MGVDKIMKKKVELALHHNSTIKDRTSWYIRIRWFFLLAIAVPGVLSNFVGEGLTAQVQRDMLLGSVALLSNGIFYVLALRKQPDSSYRRLAITMLIVDILTVTILIFTKGGIESRSPILYTIPLLMSSALFGQKGVYYTTLLSIGLYNALIMADFTQIIQTIGAVNPALRFNGTYVLNTITFFTSVLTVIALMADFITRLLSEQQEIALKNQFELEEAQRIAKIGSWSWDVASNRIEWSKQLLIMFGLKKEQFGGSFEEYLELVHPEDKALITDTIAKSLKTGDTFNFDHRIQRDGKIIWLHSEGQVKLINGKPDKLFGTAQDITQLKNAQQELISTNHDLEEMNQIMVGRELKMLELKKELNKQSSGMA